VKSSGLGFDVLQSGGQAASAAIGRGCRHGDAFLSFFSRSPNFWGRRGIQHEVAAYSRPPLKTNRPRFGPQCYMGRNCPEQTTAGSVATRDQDTD